MQRYIKFIVACLISSWLLPFCGCHQRSGDYIALSSISQRGFALNREWAVRSDGRQIKLWGYVDHRNMYGDEGARRILQGWWSGHGPTATTWRFNLKAEPEDPAGHSISVVAPNDGGRDALLRAFLADARSGRPTRVFLKGKLLMFDAPTNLRLFSGFSIEVGSTGTIRLNLSK